MRAGKKRAVGLSICSKKIAMVNVNIGFSGNPEVTNLAIADIPADAIINGIIDNPDIIAGKIRDILATSDTKAIKKISLSIEDNLTNTRLMTMPSLSDEEIGESLMSEVGDYAILAGGKPSLDFHAVRRYTIGPAERMDVLFVVAPEQLINTYLSIMESANTKLMALETIPLAVIRAYLKFIQSDQSNKTIMLVIIEENEGMIVILQNKAVKFVHDIEIGRKELEASKNTTDVLSEIRSSLDYYKKTFPLEANVDEIVLFSDNIENFNVGENLRADLNIEITEPQLPVDVITRFREKAKDNALSIFAAIGSALHDLAGKEDISINLVPGKKEAKISHVRARVTALVLALLSVVLLLIIGSAIIKYKTRTIEDDITALKEQAVLEIPNPTELAAIEESITLLKSRIDVTDVAMNSIKWANCARLLQEIRGLVPGTLWLTNLRWQEDGNVVFGGYALSYDSVFKYRRSLIESPYFDPVKLSYIRSTEVNGKPIQQFEIQCGVKTEIMGKGAKSDGTI
jgi:Tfp pilus assembly PilM family ATPase/Tfp pilus assembly protein PilN